MQDRQSICGRCSFEEGAEKTERVCMIAEAGKFQTDRERGGKEVGILQV